MTDLLKDAILFPNLEGWMVANKPDTTLTIRRVEKTEIVNSKGKFEKWAIVFQETPKSLLLNKTNTKQLIQQLGPDTDTWTRAALTLYAMPMKVSGEETHGIRIRRIAAPAKEGSGKPKKAEGDDSLNANLFS